MALPTASDNPFPSVLVTETAAASIGTPASGKQRLFVDTDHVLKYKDSSGTVSNVGAASVPLASGKVSSTTSDLTTTSTSFVDMTGITVTITTGARRCIVTFTGNVKNGATGNAVDIALLIDGVNVGGTNGLVDIYIPGNGFYANGAFAYITDALTAGSHTFKIQWRTTAGTATVQRSSTAPVTLGVVELLT